MLKKPIIIVIFLLFLGNSIIPTMTGYYNIIEKPNTISSIKNNENEQNTIMTLYTFSKTGTITNNILIPSDDADYLYSKFEKLKDEINNNPFNESTKSLKLDFIDLLAEKELIPNHMTRHDLFSLLESKLYVKKNNQNINPPTKLVNSGSASSFFCSVTSGGTGTLLPIVTSPRPRMFAIWFGQGVYDAAATAVGGLFAVSGFIALGEQTGIALGFNGIGLTYGTPFGPVYGLAGYALMVSVYAEYIETNPANLPPLISDENPRKGASEIPVDLSELSFRIDDANGDRMSYMVTTDPFIGSGSGNMKRDGQYTVPISNLKGNTQYRWHVSVSDNDDTTEKTFTFTTEKTAPVITNPIPSEGAYDIPLSLDKLEFTLTDYQEDLIDYTVETFPDIGSANVKGVTSGTHYLEVSNLKPNKMYSWTVTATDGVYSSSETFKFNTIFEPFNPFDEGWKYRKKITVDHRKIDGNLGDFPVLVSVIDSDLKNKAHSEGDDILFMEKSGVASKLSHEIEYYDDMNGELVTWVKFPTLYSTSNKVIYMYYGNPNSNSQQSPKKVWDSNYIGVYHMSESSGNLLDGTSNNRDIPVGFSPKYRITGKIGKGMDFDGNNNYFEKPNYYDVSSLTGVTFEVWYKPSLGWSTSEWPYIVTLGQGNSYVQELGVRWVGITSHDRYGQFEMISARYALADRIDSTQKYFSGWHYVVGTFTDSQIRIYVDGSHKGSDVSDINDFSDFTDDYIEIGRSNRKYSGWEYHSGIFDEIRISNIVRSPEWISTSFNSMDNPSSFLSFGSEELGP